MLVGVLVGVPVGVLVGEAVGVLVGVSVGVLILMCLLYILPALTAWLVFYMNLSCMYCWVC